MSKMRVETTTTEKYNRKKAIYLVNQKYIYILSWISPSKKRNWGFFSNVQILLPNLHKFVSEQTNTIHHKHKKKNIVQSQLKWHFSFLIAIIIHIDLFIFYLISSWTENWKLFNRYFLLRKRNRSVREFQELDM